MLARLPRWLAALILIFTGVARGAGGALLLARGPAVDEAILAAPAPARGLGLLLLLIALWLIASGVQLFFRSDPRVRLRGVVAVVVFFLDGLLNGAMLYGRPQAGGTLANLLVVLAVLALLMLGRRERPGESAAAPARDAE